MKSKINNGVIELRENEPIYLVVNPKKLILLGWEKPLQIQEGILLLNNAYEK